MLVIDLPASSVASWTGRLLAGAGLLVLLVWWAGPEPATDPGLRLALALGALVCCALPLLVRFEGPCRLRLDASGWALARDGGAWQPGRLAVGIDLGAWMVLRFDAARRRHWLAADRRGLGASWHGLRCALYSPPFRTGLDTEPGGHGSPRTAPTHPNECP